MNKKRKKRNNFQPSNSAANLSNINKTKIHIGGVKILAFLAGSGIFALLATGAYQYLEGSVSLDFLHPLGRGYEFQIKNDTPSDKVVKSLRVVPPSSQPLIYHVTQDIYGKVGEDGKISLPGEGETYIPAVEYKELDGRKISSSSDIKFRIPPLSDRPWMEPDAAIFSIQYIIESTNPVLASFEHMMNAIGFTSTSFSVKYLVVNNYWIPTTSSSPTEAIRIFCRDNNDAVSASTCRQIK